MKQYIKYIIESLFDDDDIQIVTVTDMMSDSIIKKTMDKLKNIPNNCTIYPEGIKNIDLYIQATKIGEEICRFVAGDTKIEFVFYIDVDENTEQVTTYISTRKSDYKSLKVQYTTDKHISLLTLFPSTLFCSDINKYSDTYQVSLNILLDLINTGYIIDELTIDYDTTYNIKLAKEFTFYTFKEQPVTLTQDIIKKFPKFTNEYKLQYSYPHCVMNFKDKDAIIEFFNYLKQCGFKQYDYRTYMNMSVNNHAFIDSEPIFFDFMLKNLFVCYKFTKKQLETVIYHLIEHKAYRYCENNLKYDSNNSDGMFSMKVLKDKQKDDKGKFIYIVASPEYRDTDNKYRHVSLKYKVYACGLIVFDEVISDGLPNLDFWKK